MDAPQYRRSEAVSFTELDGELICLNLEVGQYVGMKDVAQTIWQRLDEPRRVEDIVRGVTAEYEVEHDQATSDVRAFLSELVEAGLVETV